jgi:hypothetical protein
VTANAPAISVIGVSHRTCPDSLRERLYVDDSEVAAVIGTLRIRGVREAMVLSTCDRVEVTAVFQDGPMAPMTVATALGAPVGLRGEELAPYLYRHDGGEAVRHVFRVASALDSQVVGEPQVLGQVKAAQRLSQDLGAWGPTLDRVLQAAYAVAKRVRTETRIGEGAVSLATAAVARVQDLHGDLSGRSCLLVGGDELSVMIARQLRDAGLHDLTVLDRFRRRAAVTAWTRPMSTTSATSSGSPTRAGPGARPRRPGPRAWSRKRSPPSTTTWRCATPAPTSPSCAPTWRRRSGPAPAPGRKPTPWPGGSPAGCCTRPAKRCDGGLPPDAWTTRPVR